MLEDLKLKDAIDLLNALNKKSEHQKDIDLWKVGKSYFIRTVTMHLIGKLEVVNSTELLLKNAVWVADSGRFHDALKKGTLSEVEPFVTDVIVNRTSIIDACEWIHDLPKEQK